MSYELSQALTAAYARIADLEAQVAKLEDDVRLAHEDAFDWRMSASEKAAKIQQLEAQVGALVNDRDSWRSAHANASSRAIHWFKIAKVKGEAANRG